MREHKSARKALEALPEIAQQAGVQNYTLTTVGAAEAELSAAIRLDAQMLCYGAPDYPQALYDVPDAPPYLWAVGRVDLAACAAVAMVGARNASVAGKAMATRLSRDLGGAGFATISGMARGIDLAVHDASVETGTIAVLAGGVDVDYPKESANCAARLREHGLVVSEMPPGLQPQARHFPRRNRIISGMSCAVVIVEGAVKSGSLITAKNALDYGREVMAVPGSPLDARSGGCNALIRDGAILVRNAQDILEVIAAEDSISDPPLAKQQSKPQTIATQTRMDTIRAQTVLARLGPTPISEDDLIADLGENAGTIMGLLGELELDGDIIRGPGGTVCRPDMPRTRAASR